MAHVLSTSAINGLTLSGRFRHLLDRLRELRARRKRYGDTMAELSALSDRGLADLGIARCDISRIAREHADFG